MLRDGSDAGHSRTRLPAFAALALVVCSMTIVLWAPSAAQAGGCGGVQIGKPKKKLNPGGHAPLAIGDSTMLFALPNLARAGFKVNARGCRGWSEGMALMRRLRRQKDLPHLTVIALGADYSITRRDIRQALHITGKKRILALVTPRELGGGTSNDDDVVRRAYRSHTQRIILLDWVRYSKGKGGWFQPDGLHLTFSGARNFTKLVRKSAKYAKHGEHPDRVRYPR